MYEQKFGGPWTLVKLTVLKKYLEAYANVFKNLKYKLIYIDAFAGSGKCFTRAGEIDGSAKIALNTPRFDEYIFIEYDQNNYNELLQLKKLYPYKKITIINGDCNKEINKIIDNYNWKFCRALLFLDPYSFELDFNTHFKIASTKAFDIWYLFPISYATRYLTNNGNISKVNESNLNKLFGKTNWKDELYIDDPQVSIFELIDGKKNSKRVHQDKICCYFRKRLETVYPSTLCPICLKNSNNAPLFLLYFVISNPDKKAIKIASNIAQYLIDKENKYICKKCQS